MVSSENMIKRRAHSMGALSSVHEAAAKDGRPGRFALKIFHPPPSTNVRRFLVLERWLLAYEQQKTAAGAGSAVTPVSWGRCDEGVYVVLPWQDNSLEPLIETMRPTGDRLRALATVLLQALARWETAFGGPHGNLKPSNVFLDGAGPLATRTALLSDPACTLGLKTDELRQRDFAAIGAMLVRLVRGRAAGGWPIDDAPEWHRLGRAGAAWREYCNFLLDPTPTAERSTTEALRRLERIPRDARPGRTVSLAAAGVVVAASTGVLGFARFGSPDAMPADLLPVAEWVGNPRAFRTEVSPEWALLCRAWATWTADVLRNAERWQRTDELWLDADPLRPALAAFRTDAPPLEPTALVPESAGFSLGVLADAPPEAVQQQLLRASVDRRIKAAWARLDEFAQTAAAWPRWTEMGRAAEQLSARGFPRVAAELAQRSPFTTGADAPPADLMMRAFNTLSQDRDGVLALLPRWDEFEALAAELTASGDRVQAALPRLALASVADRSSIGDFADAILEPLAQLRQRRAEFLAPAVVRERFLREAPILTGAGEVTEQDVAVWSQQLREFSRVAADEDPRQQEAWDERLLRLARAGADLEAEAPPSEDGSRTLARGAFDGELADLRRALGVLRERVVVRRDVPALTAEVDRWAATVAELERIVDATLALLRPELWLQRIASETWQFPASQQRWQTWRERHLASVAPTALDQDRARFRQLRDNARALEQWLDDLEGPSGFGPYVEPVLDGRSAPTSEALTDWARKRAGETAALVLTRVEWSDERPREPWAQAHTRPAVRELIQAQARWFESLPALAGELDNLGELLNAGLAWSEGVADVYGRLSAVADIGSLGGAPRRWLDEAGRLRAVAESVDRAVLVAAAQAEGLSLRLTAWRRLGALEDWPASAADLDIDGGLVAGLRTRIEEAVTQSARRDALREELARETRRRWNRAARQAARDAAALAQVFQRMDRFGIGAADLDAPVAYNLRLWQLKQADANEADLERLRARRDAFIASVRSDATIAADPDVSGFLEALAALGLKDDPSRPVARSPSAAGWTEELAEGGQRVRVRWQSGSRAAELEYQLVQPDDGTPPFYLACRTVAVGEFVDLLTSHPESAAVWESLPAWARREGDGSEPWTAPMTWRPRGDRRGVELNPLWIYRPDAQVAPLLTEDATVPIVETLRRERPTPRSPLQRISPGTARLLAERIFGARLPTPAEWRAVAAGRRLPERANVRDARFGELWTFLEQHRVANQTIAWRPNHGIFLPLQQIEDGPRTRRVPLVDSGRVLQTEPDSHLWLAPVDEGPEVDGFVHLFGNTWIYLCDASEETYYVAGGSALSPPELDPLQPQKVESIPLIGQRRGRALTDGFSDVGLRPAFDAPPGLRDRFEMLRLVRAQQFLTL